MCSSYRKISITISVEDVNPLDVPRLPLHYAFEIKLASVDMYYTGDTHRLVPAYYVQKCSYGR